MDRNAGPNRELGGSETDLIDFDLLRERMVERQIAARGLDDPALLAAFRAVPREAFVDKAYRAQAYQDSPLPIAGGQTISQPYIVALTISAAEIGAGQKILEVGAGSGYAAAVISRIAKEVVAIERLPGLAGAAQERLAGLGYDNVRIVAADGTLGLAKEAPFDAIVAAASGSHVPERWISQLKPGGRVVMPVGEPDAIQHLIKIRKRADGTLESEDLGGVRFVPLIGEEGY